MIQSDSPFPPLKVDHRYRGVYERAGFDVNVGGSPTEGGSILGKSRSPTFAAPSQRAVSDSRETYGQRNVSSRSMPQSASTPISDGARFTTNKFHPLRKSPSPQLAEENLPYPQSDKNYSDVQPNNYSYQQNTSLPNIAISSETEQVTGDSDDGVHGKNVKNLQLSLHDSNFANFPPDQTESSSSTNSQTFENHIDKASTPNTPASSNEVYGEKADRKSTNSVDTTELFHSSFGERLSQEFVNFKQEVQVNKGFDPRRNGSKRYGPGLTNDSTHKLSNHGSDDLNNENLFQSTANKSITNLRSSGPNAAKPATQSEFQTFLTAESNKDQMLRYSQLSTVSSIISKDYGDAHPDDEIDIELQRQLDDLKTGDFVADVRKESVDGTESYFTANSSVETEQADPIVPVIQVRDTSRNLFGSDTISETGFDTESAPQENIPSRSGSIPQVQENRILSPNVIPRDVAQPDNVEQECPLLRTSDNSKVNNQMYFEVPEHVAKHQEQEPDLNDSEEEVAPLLSERNPARVIRPPYPTTPLVSADQFEDNSNTPETIKPLSPKNHRVEEELKNMNFNYDEGPIISHKGVASVINNDSFDLEDIDALHSEIILLQNEAPEGFDAFPKSVMALNTPNFRTSTSGVSVPPGTGPCRTCNKAVDERGRGYEKPIYSKSGDLSGQWHRGCFSCIYAGCTVRFNRDVACYSLLDNAFCQRHYHLLNGTLCQSCGNAIEGECIENELKQKWHVSCLKCSECHGGISADYYLIKNAIVCEKDAPAVIATLEKGGMLTSEKIEKRRTRILYLD